MIASHKCMFAKLTNHARAHRLSKEKCSDANWDAASTVPLPHQTDTGNHKLASCLRS